MHDNHNLSDGIDKAKAGSATRRSDMRTATYIRNQEIAKDITMKAVWQGVIIAESDDTIVVEGNHYFPLESIQSEYFRDSNHQSTCSWKGVASYYSIHVGGESNENAAWYYTDPKPEASMTKDRIAFWRGVEVTD